MYYLKRKRENFIQELKSLSFPWHHTRWTWNVLDGKMEKERIVESRIEKSSLLSFCGREGTNWQKRWVAREKVSMEVQIITRSVDKITLPKCFKPQVQIMQQLTSLCIRASQTPRLPDKYSQTSWLPGWGYPSLGILNSKRVKAWYSKLHVKSFWSISKVENLFRNMRMRVDVLQIIDICMRGYSTLGPSNEEEKNSWINNVLAQQETRSFKGRAKKK